MISLLVGDTSFEIVFTLYVIEKLGLAYLVSTSIGDGLGIPDALMDNDSELLIREQRFKSRWVRCIHIRGKV